MLFGVVATPVEQNPGFLSGRASEAEEPVSTLINDFGPPVASASAERQRAAMPFVHLEREI
jgi:putative restriction endonuclease